MYPTRFQGSTDDKPLKDCLQEGDLICLTFAIIESPQNNQIISNLTASFSTYANNFSHGKKTIKIARLFLHNPIKLW